MMVVDLNKLETWQRAIYLLYLGSIKPRYGELQACLLAPSVRSVLHGDPAITTVIDDLAGDGEWRRAARRLSARKAALTKSGALDDAKAARWYRAAQSYLQRNQSESFRVAVIEPHAYPRRVEGVTVYDEARVLEVCYELALKCVDPAIEREWGQNHGRWKLYVWCDFDPRRVASFLRLLIDRDRARFLRERRVARVAERLADIDAMIRDIERSPPGYWSLENQLWDVVRTWVEMTEMNVFDLQYWLGERIDEDPGMARPSYAEAIYDLGARANPGPRRRRAGRRRRE